MGLVRPGRLRRRCWLGRSPRRRGCGQGPLQRPPNTRRPAGLPTGSRMMSCAHGVAASLFRPLLEAGCAQAYTCKNCTAVLHQARVQLSIGLSRPSRGRGRRHCVRARLGGAWHCILSFSNGIIEPNLICSKRLPRSHVWLTSARCKGVRGESKGCGEPLSQAVYSTVAAMSVSLR